MGKGVYVAASGSMSRLQQLEVLANNLAHVNTPGFKRDAVTFQQVLADNGRPDLQLDPQLQDKGYAQTVGTHTRLDAGELVRTDNTLDVAVRGDGWLNIETPRGTRLTRNGRLMRGSDGLLKTQLGYPVLDQAGQRIALPPDRPPVIAEDGGIRAGTLELGRLAVTRVDVQATQLKKDPDGFFVPPDEGVAPPTGGQPPAVLQGYLEDSNVSPVSAMTQLIEVQRHFQALHQVISAYQRMDEAANRLPRG